MTILTGSELLDKQKLVDTIISGLRTTENQNYNGRIHASSSGYCGRRGALEASYDGEVEYSASSSAYFKLGLALEDLVLGSLNRQKLLLFSQYSLPPNPINLGGRADGIMLWEGKIYVLEIKSCGKLPDKPQPEHLAQLNIYSAFTGLPGMLIYVSRNVSDYNNELLLQPFNVGFDGDAISNSLENSTIAYFASKNNVLPDIPDHITKQAHCGFCKFVDLCWNGQENDILTVTDTKHVLEIEKQSELFVSNFMQVSELHKRRNGVLNWLSIHGNSTAKFYLDKTEWESFLIEF